MKTYYVTVKAAGPKGIVTVEASPGSMLDGSGNLTDEEFITVGGKILTVGKDAFESLDDARVDAIKRARKKINTAVKAERKLESKIAVWEAELPL